MKKAVIIVILLMFILISGCGEIKLTPSESFENVDESVAYYPENFREILPTIEEVKKSGLTELEIEKEFIRTSEEYENGATAVAINTLINPSCLTKYNSRCLNTKDIKKAFAVQYEEEFKIPYQVFFAEYIIFENSKNSAEFFSKTRIVMLSAKQRKELLHSTIGSESSIFVDEYKKENVGILIFRKANVYITIHYTETDKSRDLQQILEELGKDIENRLINY